MQYLKSFAMIPMQKYGNDSIEIFEFKFSGNPLVQPEFEGASVESIRFITLRNDPGWLMIDEYSGNLFVGDVPR